MLCNYLRYEFLNIAQKLSWEIMEQNAITNNVPNVTQRFSRKISINISKETKYKQERIQNCNYCITVENI